MTVLASLLFANMFEKIHLTKTEISVIYLLNAISIFFINKKFDRKKR